jgi:hypothetical protein
MNQRPPDKVKVKREYGADHGGSVRHVGRQQIRRGGSVIC